MACRINSHLRWPLNPPLFSSTSYRQNPLAHLHSLRLSSSSLSSKYISHSSGRCRRRRFLAVKSDLGTEKNTVSEGRMLVYVPPHPLIKHWVSVLRNEQTPHAIFKSAMAELGRLLMYEASRDWLL